MSLLAEFSRSLAGPDPVATLRAGLIGESAVMDGPYGPKPLVYADYVASGRALAQVEDFIRDRVLPYYANSHTEASFTGATMTRLREEARGVIAAKCGANHTDHAVIFAGSGATTGTGATGTVWSTSRRVTRPPAFRVTCSWDTIPPSTIPSTV